MHVQPMYDRLLLKRQEAETKSKGGLILTQGSQVQNHLCTVVAVGHGRLNADGSLSPLKIEAGQTVMIGKWSGDEIKIGDVDHLMVRESDILAVIS